MSTYTWTHVRIDKLTPKMIESCINHAKWLSEGTTYHKYCNQSWEEALDDWLKMHKDNYDYFVKTCGVDPKKLEKDYLTKQLKKRLKDHKFKMKCYDKCLAGEMTVEDMLYKTHQINGHSTGILIIKRQEHYYINIFSEIFRNYEYCDEEFHTVDALIEHCRQQTGNQFIDYSEKNPVYVKWNKELEDRVREYYSSIGDDNFYVQFV